MPFSTSNYGWDKPRLPGLLDYFEKSGLGFGTEGLGIMDDGRLGI